VEYVTKQMVNVMSVLLDKIKSVSITSQRSVTAKDRIGMSLVVAKPIRIAWDKVFARHAGRTLIVNPQHLIARSRLVRLQGVDT
jgi:hypothetical protein